jgi:hypothetical protein|tara:strand:- start:6961 stop:7269 length:309 start_codon:yes stop_codon:yes gene_type:complete
MKNFIIEIKQMLSSEDNSKLSSKRVITFMAFILVSIVFLSDAIFHIVIDENMFDGMIQIVWAGLGVTVGEHLLKKANNNKKVETTTKVDTPLKKEEIEYGDS